MPGALRTAPDVARRQGCRVQANPTALRGEANLSIVVIGNYSGDPITAVSCRAKEHPLHPRRSYFAPINSPLDVRDASVVPGRVAISQWAVGGGAGYRPRVRNAYSIKRLSP